MIIRNNRSFSFANKVVAMVQICLAIFLFSSSLIDSVCGKCQTITISICLPFCFNNCILSSIIVQKKIRNYRFSRRRLVQRKIWNHGISRRRLLWYRKSFSWWCSWVPRGCIRIGIDLWRRYFSNGLSKRMFYWSQPSVLEQAWGRYKLCTLLPSMQKRR